MQKSVLAVLTLSIGLATSTVSFAEMVQSQPLNNSVESSNLVNRVLDQNNQSISTALFKMNSPALAVASSKPVTITALSSAEALVNRNKNDSLANRPEDNTARESAKPVVKNTDPSIIDRLSTVASEAVRKFTQTGMASWYGRQFHGRKTASGDTFDMYAMTAAHRSLPLNCFIRVTNKDNGKSVVVKVNDRGPFHGNRVLDLSYGAANKLGIAGSGTGNVMIERIDNPNL